MKRALLALLPLMLPLVLISCSRVNPPASPQVARTSLWDQFADLVIQDLKANGPNPENAQYASSGSQYAWKRRNEFVDLAAPWLKVENPEQVALAIQILYGVCSYQPLGLSSGMEDPREAFRRENKEFYARVDKIVYDQMEHFHALKSDAVLHKLALWLGSRRTPEAKDQLKRIITDPVATNSKEQALICLTWHRDPKDMDFLLPYMLEDSDAARSLPYHFRNSYGEAAIPCLMKALREAKRNMARVEAAGELVHLRVPAGFEYLHDLVLRKPGPDEAGSSDQGMVVRFAQDYLGMPANVTSKEKIAAFISKRQKELCETEPAE